MDHDIFYVGTTQSVAVTSTAASTAVFGTQTRAIRIAALGSTVNSNSWVFMKLGTALEAPSASTLADVPIPINVPSIFKCRPGQKMSLISPDATTSFRCYIEMGFYGAVDHHPDFAAEARKLERLEREAAEAEAKLREELEPEAKRAGVPLNDLVQLVKLKHLAPAEFARLQREVNRRNAELEQQEIRGKK